MGRASMQPKFVPVNLNKSYGEGISPSPSSPSSSTSSSSTSSFGSAIHRARPHGGMVLLTRPSKSSLSLQQTPILNLQKENARSVWSRQQAPITSKSDLGPCQLHVKDDALAVNQNLDGRLPLMPHTYKFNESPHIPRLVISNNVKHSGKVSLLREEDFPSLSTLPTLRHQQMLRFTDQDLQSKPDREAKLLQLSQLKAHPGNSLYMQHQSRLASKPSQPLQKTMSKSPVAVLNQNVWCKNDVKVAKDKLDSSTPTCAARWADDERETLSTSSVLLEEIPNNQDQGAWSEALRLKDQASRWDIQFELAVSSKESISAADCLVIPPDIVQERWPLACGNVGYRRDVPYQKNVLDKNFTEDDNWQLNKLKRLYGYNTDHNSSIARDRYSQGLEGGCFLQRTLEHPLSRSFLGIAKPDFDMEAFFELKLKARKRKSEEAGEVEFRDLARESFEAELEKVQEMLEQERFLMVDGGKEGMTELAAMQHEEKKGLCVEIEMQVQHEADTEKELEKSEVEVEESTEVKAKEVPLKEGRLITAREQERKKILLEEERRKERATMKLLELEERIAKREAEKCLANATLHFPVDGCEKEKLLEFCVTSNDAPIEEQLDDQLGLPNDHVKLSLPSSSTENPVERSEMLSCKARGQEVASSQTPGYLHDLDMVGAISELPPEQLQLLPPLASAALRSDDPMCSHDKDILPDEGSLEKNEHGAGNNTKDVINVVQDFEQLRQMVASEDCSLELESHHELCDEHVEEASASDEQGGTPHTTAFKGLASEVSSVLKDGEHGGDQGGGQNLDGLLIADCSTKAHAPDCMRLEVQDIECGEHLTVAKESKKSFEHVPSASEKANVSTLSGLLSSWHGSRECFDSQGLQQPVCTMPQTPIASACLLVSTDDHEKPQEAISLDTHSTAPFMLHAIQIGSIQMPLSNAGSWTVKLAPLHDIQASSLQFGQLCSISIDQPLSTALSTLPVHSVVGETPEHQEVDAEACTSVQHTADLVQKWDRIFFPEKMSSSLSGKHEMPRQTDSVEASSIQFGEFSSSVLHKQCLSHLHGVRETSTEHVVNAESCALKGIDSHSLKHLDQSFGSAEKPVVDGRPPCQNALTIGHVSGECALAPCFRFKEQNPAPLVSHRVKKTHLEAFPAIPGRQKRGSEGTSAQGCERKYWRASTMKMKYVKVSHLAPERVRPGLGGHDSSLYRSIGRFVYRKKELPDSEKLYQTNLEPDGLSSANVITIPQKQNWKEAGACQKKSAVSMNNNAGTASESLCNKLQFVASDESAMQHGVVYVFKQQGIYTPSSVDDFIEVKSRRQMLRKQRKEEDETKSGSKSLKIAAHQQRSFKLVQSQRDQANHQT